MKEQMIEFSLSQDAKGVQKGREEGMIDTNQYGAIVSLRRQGCKKKKIARLLGIDVRTVRRYLKMERWKRYERNKKVLQKIAPYKEYVEKRMAAVDYNAMVLYREIRERGYEGRYEMVKLMVRPHREERRLLEEATVRYETMPGKQAQVDWGTMVVPIGGEMKRVQIFVMVLGYSRRLYAEGRRDQRVKTMIECHEKAFEHFGGRTEDILYDNPKTVCVERSGGGVKLNPLFEDFSRYYGYKVRLCRPYRARTKGKVESGVKYVKGNFLKGQSFESFEHLNRELMRWCVEVADERVHGTMYRKPREMYEEEKLISVTEQARYAVMENLTRRVPSDCLVSYQTNRYSVPVACVGRTVELMVSGERLRIYEAGEKIAEHALSVFRHQRIIEPTHYAALFRKRTEKKENGRRSSLISAVWPEVEVRSLSDYEAVLGGTR